MTGFRIVSRTGRGRRPGKRKKKIKFLQNTILYFRVFFEKGTGVEKDTDLSYSTLSQFIVTDFFIIIKYNTISLYLIRPG